MTIETICNLLLDGKRCIACTWTNERSFFYDLLFVLFWFSNFSWKCF